MTTELYWLVLTILLTATIWVPYILNRLIEQGIPAAVWDPDGNIETSVLWSKRMMAAHTNAVENLLVFAPLVIILHMLNISTELTVMASILFFFSRLVHVVVFTFRIPVLRIVAFLSGFSAQMILIATLLAWI